MEIALVTGGSSGIGRSTVRELQGRGMGVITTWASRSVEGPALRLDLADRTSFPLFVEGVQRLLREHWGRDTFDVLVNNAGVGEAQPFAEATEEHFDRMLGVNFGGPFFLTQRLLPLLADGGRIVNVTSSSAVQTFPGYSAYGSAKAAAVAWSRYLAKELSPRGIRVNSVSPGPTRTDFGGGGFEKHPEYIAPLVAQTALGRLGEPEDVARVIAALASPDGGWVTGQDLIVSGGFLL